MTNKTPGRPPVIDAAAVARCQAEGMTQRETAEALGISKAAAAIYWNSTGKRGNARGSQYAEQIAALIATGQSDLSIAAELGIDRTTVYRHRQKLQG